MAGAGKEEEEGKEVHPEVARCPIDVELFVFTFNANTHPTSLPFSPSEAGVSEHGFTLNDVFGFSCPLNLNSSS